MCHNIAVLYQVADRGFIREGYFADLVVIDPELQNTVTRSQVLSKCGWSPLEGFTLPSSITHTMVNGHLVYGNGVWDESHKGQRLLFNR
jgi:dihydroorotase